MRCLGARLSAMTRWSSGKEVRPRLGVDRVQVDGSDGRGQTREVTPELRLTLHREAPRGWWLASYLDHAACGGDDGQPHTHKLIEILPSEWEVAQPRSQQAWSFGMHLAKKAASAGISPENELAYVRNKIQPTHPQPSEAFVRDVLEGFRSCREPSK